MQPGPWKNQKGMNWEKKGGMLGVRDQTTQSPHAQGPRQEGGRAANLRKPEGDGGRAGAAKTSQSQGTPRDRASRFF